MLFIALFQLNKTNKNHKKTNTLHVEFHNSTVYCEKKGFKPHKNGAWRGFNEHVSFLRDAKKLNANSIKMQLKNPNKITSIMKKDFN